MRKLALILATFPLFAQQPAGSTFEVVSIKPFSLEDMASGKVAPGIHVSTSQATFRAPLSSLLLQAYRLQPYQLTVPDWMRSVYFEILAKVPDGGTADQVPQMLQAVLTDRFKLQVHHEQKEMPAYVLLKGKNGAKLKEAPAEATPDFRSTSLPNGVVRFKITGDLTFFAQSITFYAGRPVLDQTGLRGIYEITMDVTPDTQANQGNTFGLTPQGPAVASAVEQLGLKMEARKEPIDILVVDHAEKVPTEN